MEPFRVVAFDLDGTLARTAELTDGRRSPSHVLQHCRAGAKSDALSFGPGVNRLPATLMRRGAGVAVITRSPAAYASTLLHLLNVDCHLLLASQPIPDPVARLRAVVGQFRIAPTELLYLGDRVEDAGYAAAVGCQFLRPPWLDGSDDVTWIEMSRPAQLLAPVTNLPEPPTGSLLETIEQAVHRGQSLSEDVLSAVASSGLDAEHLAQLGTVILRAAPCQRHREVLQEWATTGGTVASRRCRVLVDFPAGVFAPSPSVIRREEHVDDLSARGRLFNLLRTIYPLRQIHPMGITIPVYALSAFQDTYGGTVLRFAKNWGGTGKGHSGPEVNLRLLETPSVTLAAALSAGDLPIVPVAPSPYSDARPGETSLRIAVRIAQLTGRECLPVLSKQADGSHVATAVGAGRGVIVVDDQVTHGGALRASIAALTASGWDVRGAVTWSASTRFGVPATIWPERCWNGPASLALRLNAICPNHTDNTASSHLRDTLGALPAPEHRKSVSVPGPSYTPVKPDGFRVASTTDDAQLHVTRTATQRTLCGKPVNTRGGFLVTGPNGAPDAWTWCQECADVVPHRTEPRASLVPSS